MIMIKRIRQISTLGLLCNCLALNGHAQSTSADKATGEIAAAAKTFLATLDEVQRGRAVYDFKDDAQRRRWSNLPTSFVKRGGLRMGDLTKPQRGAVMAVLAAALSPRGYEKVTGIVEGDEVLKRNDRGDPAGRPCSDTTSITFPSLASLPQPSRG